MKTPLATKKLLSVLLALVLALSAGVGAAAFRDVPEDAWYAEAVAWAAEQEITNGRGDDLFAPEATVTRAEAATFLWRMAGKPDSSLNESFEDVERDPNNVWYGYAVLWAVEAGITNGTGEGKFSPSLTCSRGMILTMLYRLEGCPFDAALEAELPENPFDWTAEDVGNQIIQSLVQGFRTESIFPDVPSGAYYELPVYWASVNGLLDESLLDPESRAVRPDAPCPRGEMAGFLYRTAAYEEAVKAAEESNQPIPPAEVGTVPETVVLDEKGVRITVTGISPDSFGGAELELSIVNGSDRELYVSADSLFVNSYSLIPSVYIRVEEEWGYSYSEVSAAPGETKAFWLGLDELREAGISTVYELEFRVSVYSVTGDGEEQSYEDYAVGDAVSLRTSLYDPAVSYDPEGTPVYDKDGLRLYVTRAENAEYGGPQITVVACNGGSGALFLSLAELKLDGERIEDADWSAELPAGKRAAETVSIYFEDYDSLPEFREAELRFCLLDPETWEPTVTFEPVTVPFTG